MRPMRLVLLIALMGALLPWGAFARHLPPPSGIAAEASSGEDAHQARPGAEHETPCRLAGALGAACLPAALSPPPRAQDPPEIAPDLLRAEGAWPARSRADVPPRDPPRPV